MRFAAVCLFASCLAPVPKERAEAEQIVGTWKMTLDSNGESTTHLEIDFHQGGKMVIRQGMTDGTAMTYEGTYNVVGSELPYELTRGREKKETLTITKLTADELVVVDPDGLKEEFARAKKKAEKK